MVCVGGLIILLFVRRSSAWRSLRRKVLNVSLLLLVRRVVCILIVVRSNIIWLSVLIWVKCCLRKTRKLSSTKFSSSLFRRKSIRLR